MQFNVGDKVIFYKDDYTNGRFGLDDEEMEDALNRRLVLEVTGILDNDGVYCNHPTFTVDYSFDVRDLRLAEEIKTEKPKHKTYCAISGESMDNERLTLKELYEKYGSIKIAHETAPHVHAYNIIGPSLNFPDQMILESPEGMVIRMYNKVNTMVPHQEPPKTLKDMKTFEEKREYIKNKLDIDESTLPSQLDNVTDVFMDILDELEE